MNSPQNSTFIIIITATLTILTELSPPISHSFVQTFQNTGHQFHSFTDTLCRIWQEACMRCGFLILYIKQSCLLLPHLLPRNMIENAK